MRPPRFADLLKHTVTAVAHPGVVRVRTCADIGRHEQPCGVRVDLTDGWALLVQVVRGAPPGGDSPDDGSWDDGVDYRAARVEADGEAATVTPLRKGGRPQARVGALLDLILGAVAGADPTIVSAEVSARPGAQPVLRVTCADGATLFGLPVGWFAPGSTELMHPAHQIPADWY